MQRRIEAAGSVVTLLVTAEESDGRAGVIEMTTAPGPMPSTMHWHTREAWTAHILEGCIRIRFDDGERDLQAGEVIHVPARRAFSWSNALVDRSSRILFVYTPGGFERYFLEIGELFASGKPFPELLPGIVALSEKYGIERQS
jgi:mannose-6-phosphate isomerase-like protein (cupin superfamily)